jgi:MFS family permease
MFGNYSNRTSNAKVLFGFLFAINLMNYIDRMLISGLLETIGKDLHLNDMQLGEVAIAFLIPYSFLTPVVGWVGDHSNRISLIAIAITIWSVATGAVGRTRNFVELLATRAAVGLGEATYMTAAPTLIADLFPLSKRATVLALFYSASPVGAAFGVLLAGVIASAYNWRWSCIIVGFPGILLALGISRFQEPDRGQNDPGMNVGRPSLRVAFQSLVKNKPFVMLVFAFSAEIFAYNPIEFWLPTLLQRDKSISLLRANSLFGVVVFAAGFLGPLLAGVVGDFLNKRNPTAYYWICAGSAFGLIVPVLVVASAEQGHILFGAIFFAILFGNMSTALVVTLLVTLVAPGLRGTATAISITVAHLFGDAISQPAIGTLSEYLRVNSTASNVFSRIAIFACIPQQHYLSLAITCVVVPAAILATGTFIAAIPVKSA